MRSINVAFSQKPGARVSRGMVSRASGSGSMRMFLLWRVTLRLAILRFRFERGESAMCSEARGHVGFV